MRLLAEWNMLMITTVGSDGALLSNKAISPTWVSTCSVNMGPISTMAKNVLSHFKWNNAVLLHDLSSVAGYVMARNSLLGMAKLDLISINSSKSTNFTAELQHFKSISRILIIMCHGDILRKIMLQAYGFNMTNGEYVYIPVMWFSFGKMMPPYTWNYNDSDDVAAREAFRSVLLISSVEDIFYLPPEASREVLNTPYRAPWNQIYPASEYPIAWQGSTIAAFQILGLLLNQTLNAESSFGFGSAGRQLARKFFNQTFNLGYLAVQFSQYGERLMPEILRDMDPETGMMKPVMRQSARDTSELQVILPIDWGRPKWFDSAEAPPDTPTCGFNGDRCIKNIYSGAEFWGPIVGVALLICCILLIVWAWLKAFRSSYTDITDVWLDRGSLRPSRIDRLRGLRAVSTNVIAYSLTRSWVIDGKPRDPVVLDSNLRMIGSNLFS
ncbi:hypothetical protein BV898_15373 [Hypsibius exemplaris]|uniref:Receptor ligand binding region domain-containing protein n=1 Tax=Hypsibius exemplaris TaxID=2072580 RepID=A0A9X6RKC9_HYPEX|nr:hypothetical protein BV898_15373 [Hypsibius exemplaris]